MLKTQLLNALCSSASIAAITFLAQSGACRGDQPPMRSRIFARAAYRLVELTQQKAVEEDLRLDESEQRLLSALKSRMDDERRAAADRAMQARDADQTADERRLFRQTAAAERNAKLEHYGAAITGILSRDQATRLKQVFWQDLGGAVFGDNEVKDGLQLSKAQEREITRMAIAMRNEELKRAKLRYLAENPAPSGLVVYTASPEYRRQSFDRLCRLLDENQRQTLAGLLGKPCKTAPGRASSPAPAASDPRGASVGAE